MGHSRLYPSDEVAVKDPRCLCSSKTNSNAASRAVAETKTVAVTKADLQISLARTELGR